MQHERPTEKGGRRTAVGEGADHLVVLDDELGRQVGVDHAPQLPKPRAWGGGMMVRPSREGSEEPSLRVEGGALLRGEGREKRNG